AERKVRVELSRAPEVPAREDRLLRSDSPFQGATVGNLSPALADEMSLDQALRGVVVMEIADGSIAQQLGFQKGDIVRAVNDAKVGNVRDLVRISSSRPRVWKVTIEPERRRSLAQAPGASGSFWRRPQKAMSSPIPRTRRP
ncbi:PDZ domain-containing protein, partial [Hansschlegelia beijingensis]